MAAKVFISYRREDSKYQARDIHRAFCRAIPRDHVFMDVDSIPPGANFRKILKDWVDRCEMLLALIGPEWIDARDPKTQRRRLDNPNDFVRIEIGEALARDIPAVPVLIDGTPMPDVGLLPDDLKELVDRQAEFVEYRTFDADVERLIRKLRLSQGVGRTGSLQQPIPAPVLASSDDRYRAEGRIGTADAEVSLPASTLALINEFLTTLTPPLPQGHLVSTDIPAIGCPQDGQVGPQQAPMLPNSIRVIVPEGMEPLLAYYSAQEAFGSGVLAPRDWDCFGVYGSAGSTLYVVPRSRILDRFEKLKYGPVVVRTSLVGGTSGRFGVARISARVFPRARAFVERVRAEGVDDPADYVFSPWATDQLHRLSDFAVS